VFGGTPAAFAGNSKDILSPEKEEVNNSSKAELNHIE
jgi:hypothetical protein